MTVLQEEIDPPKGIDDLLLSGGQSTILEGGDADDYLVELMLMDDDATSDSQDDVSITNVDVYGDSKDANYLPLSMRNILENIKRLTNGWPKRVDTALFIHNSECSSISWIMNRNSLFGWLGSVIGIPPEFHRENNTHTSAEVFEELKRTVESFIAVETMPHEPPMEGHFYSCSFPEPGDGSKLNELVSRYNPETEIDADLIKAAFVTPFWGGAGGSRPAILISADAGRGSGKTTLASHIGQLAGGTIDLSAGEDASQIKQRLLSTEGLSKRVVVLDNVKSNKFTWADLEAMITSLTISGKRLYHGEASRPNNLTWIITLNGPSLCKDIAQRCVIIKLAKPSRSGSWAEETRQFIEDNRQALIADCLAFLRSERFPLNEYSRWASWEKDVVERLPEPSEVQAVISERQNSADAENEEKSWSRNTSPES